MQKVQYRLINPRLAPRRTELELPGGRESFSRARMVRANRSGIVCSFRKALSTGSSCFYPYDNELCVTRR